MRLTLLLLILLGRLANAAEGPAAGAADAGAPTPGAHASGTKKETVLAMMDILNNTGDKVEIVTYDDIRLSCKAWGSISC